MSLLSHLYPSEQKRKKSVTTDNAYYHMPDNDNPNKPEHITKEVNDKILAAYNEVVIDRLKKGDSVKLLNRLGIIRMIRYKAKRKQVNYKLSKELGRVVHHDNLEHNGQNFYLHWFRSQDAVFANKKLWSLRLVRDQMRRSPNSIREYVKKHGLNHFSTRKLYR